MDYSNCLSVHAEQNCMIHASREQTLDSDLYLVGKEVSKDDSLFEDYAYVKNAAPCSLCKRMIINAGIKRVIVRDSWRRYRTIYVDDWKKDRTSLIGGY